MRLKVERIEALTAIAAESIVPTRDVRVLVCHSTQLNAGENLAADCGVVSVPGFKTKYYSHTTQPELCLREYKPSMYKCKAFECFQDATRRRSDGTREVEIPGLDDAPMGSRSKLVADAWRQLSDEQKSEYKTKADERIVQHALKRREAINAENVKVRRIYEAMLRLKTIGLNFDRVKAAGPVLFTPHEFEFSVRHGMLSYPGDEGFPHDLDGEVDFVVAVDGNKISITRVEDDEVVVPTITVDDVPRAIASLIAVL